MTYKPIPTTAKEAFLLINDLLSSLVDVHNELMEFKLRNLVKAKDFGKCHLMLEATTNAAEELEVAMRRGANDWAQKLGEDGIKLLLAYLASLKVASAKLRDIAGRLESKSKGQPYPYNQYKNDLASYQTLVDGYTQYGNRMNDLWRRIS